MRAVKQDGYIIGVVGGVSKLDNKRICTCVTDFGGELTLQVKVEAS